MKVTHGVVICAMEVQKRLNIFTSQYQVKSLLECVLSLKARVTQGIHIIQTAAIVKIMNVMINIIYYTIPYYSNSSVSKRLFVSLNQVKNERI